VCGCSDIDATAVEDNELNFGYVYFYGDAMVMADVQELRQLYFSGSWVCELD
jgi:hypothetical protein